MQPFTALDDHAFNDVWYCGPKKNARPYSPIDPVHKRPNDQCFDGYPELSIAEWHKKHGLWID